MPLVYLNGELVEEDDAVVSVFDHGLVTGDGVFESILVEEGRPFALAEHLARLEQSATLIGLKVPPRLELERGVGLVAAQSKTRRAKVRLTVTGGRGPLASNRHDALPTVVVALSPLGDKPARPAVVVVVPWPRNERSAVAGAKTISYAENVVALAWAEAHGADEALFLNVAGNLCEGTGSNVFVALDGRLLTPPLSAGCLAGVTRALLLETFEAEEADVSSASLGDVSEAFLTSTTRGVQPISILDGRSFGDLPGPLTGSAGAAFEKLAADRRKSAAGSPSPGSDGAARDRG